MTIVVGIKCADGVVLGSDSSTTLTVNQHFRTIEQKCQKTFLVGSDVIFSGTGSVGLGQRFEDILTQVRQNPQWKETSHINLARAICANAINDFQGTGAGLGKFAALVAFTCQGAAHLCEFGIDDFQPEFKTGETWFASIGNGRDVVRINWKRAADRRSISWLVEKGILSLKRIFPAFTGWNICGLLGARFGDRVKSRRN